MNKKLTKASVQNIWDFCEDATDTKKEATERFYKYCDQLLARGDLDFDLVMKFIKDNKIKRKEAKVDNTRAKTITDTNIPDRCGMSNVSTCGTFDNPKPEIKKPRRREPLQSTCGETYSTPGC